jgi:tetratricopeptide (TPR) repeat protein
VDPLVATLLLGTLAGLPVLVAAHEVQASSSSAEDAMRKFEQAERLYERGEYDGAIEVLRSLLDENDDPVLWYNLGRAYEGAGEATAAIEAYERYLEGSPNAPDRDDVRDRISRLEIPDDPEEPPAVVVPVPQPEPVVPSPIDARSRPRVPLVVPWLVFGAGGAGIATGAVFGVLARRSEREAADAFSQVEAREIHDRARRRALAANVSFAVGGAIAAAGLTWAIVATVQRNESARVRPHGLGIAGRF